MDLFVRMNSWPLYFYGFVNSYELIWFPFDSYGCLTMHTFIWIPSDLVIPMDSLGVLMWVSIDYI